MATHDVKLKFPEFNLGKSDVAFSIRKDDELLGELRISHGAPVWFPANASHGYKLSWSKLGALLKSTAPAGLKSAETASARPTLTKIPALRGDFFCRAKAVQGPTRAGG